MEESGQVEQPPRGGRDPADEVPLLLTFLRERDAACPLCGYNLRNLVRPQCPECRQDLVLSVGIKDLRLGWLVATIAPGIFSGIAAVLLVIPILLAWPVPWFVVGADLFGWLSGLAAVALLKYRLTFLRLPQDVQRTWAIVAWGIHLAAFFVLVVSLFA
ncbi:MAG: hypothetical protein IH804_03540 [Planctomycetes bacterium]|nr:hypothetical protein [Planctomycetota bacterium]